MVNYGYCLKGAEKRGAWQLESRVPETDFFFQQYKIIVSKKMLGYKYGSGKKLLIQKELFDEEISDVNKLDVL